MDSPNRKSDKSKKNACENVQEYLVSSSLHGLRYIGTTTLSVFERVFFGVSFFMVVFLAAYFISNVYQKWRDTPVIIGLDPVSTKINDIPFPAVTICNMNQVKKSFVAGLQNDKDKIILDSICTKGDSINNDEDENVEGRWSYVRQFLLNASQTCDEMIQLCSFGKKRVDCDDIFKSVLTDEGLCCTFNAVHPSLMFRGFDQNDQLDLSLSKDIEYMTWTPESGYEDTDKDPYPYPVHGSGSHMGLTLMVNADVKNYYCSSTSSSGFKVLLHSPIETPAVSNYGYFIATGMEANVVINPRISVASELIRKIPIKQRQCIFANEANLSYYKIYSKKNCEMECSSMTTEKECGCTLYYMPRNFNNGSKICNRQKALCYEKVLFDIAHSLNDDFSCNYCLPACFEINYGREISSARLGTGSFYTVENLSSADPTFIHDNLGIIHIYFLENSYGGFTKSELIGFTEFLSNTGGLLGLFMGFSVISLIELIYFLTLRPYCAKQRLETQRQTADEKIEFNSKLYNNSFRCVNKTTIIGNKASPTPLLDYFKQSQAQKFNFCQEIVGGLVSACQWIKTKLMNGWSAAVNLFAGRPSDEGQTPYPFYN